MRDKNDWHPRIAVLGTGAQGASVAADFALVGHDVTFIDQWPDHVEAIRKHGITVNFPDRQVNVKAPALHLCQIAEVKVPFDLVFLVVKAYDTKWACELIKPVLAKDGLLVGLQNGMTHEDIAGIIGRERTIGAVIEMASNMWVPGVTNRENDIDTAWFALGALDQKVQPRVEAVADILRLSGRVEVMDDIRSAKWMKLVVNAAELIPSALVNMPLGEAARRPDMLKVMRQAGYEAIRAALSDGAQIVPIIGMPPVTTNHPERFVDSIFEEVLTQFSTATTLTCSLQDWRKGRRAEIEEVNGWVVDMLKKHGQPSPVNERVVALALEIESGKRELGLENEKLMLAALPSE